MASDPCKPSEAMIKISKLFELPIVCGALYSKPEVAASGFPFLSLLNHLIIVNGMRGKITPPSREGKGGLIPWALYRWVNSCEQAWVNLDGR